MLLRWQREGLVANRFANATTADALGANALGADLSTRENYLDGLQIGQESTARDPGDFGTNAT